jgi:large subunit ribosomal protein L14e
MNMASLEIGRVCMKIAGREAGEYCVVLKSPEKSFVLVTGPKVLTGIKRRKSNIAHLEPTQHRIEISEDATDDQVAAALQKSGLVKKFGLKMPSAAQLKAKEKKQEEKAAAKTETKTEEKPKKKEAKSKEKK